MADIVTREVGDTAKGSALSYEELDNNFINLNTEVEDLYVKLGYDSAGFITNGGYTNNGDGTITLPYNDILIYDNSDYSGYPNKFTITGGTTGTEFVDIVEGVTNYIVAEYNSGNPRYTITTDLAIIDWATVLPYITVFRDGTAMSAISWDTFGLGLANKLNTRIVRTRRFEFEEQPTIAETTNREFTVSSAQVWNGANTTSLAALDSTVDQLSFWYHSSGTWARTAITQYNNTQYDNGTDLVSLNPNTFAINWIYRCVCDSPKFAIILANKSYSTLQTAMYSAPPSSIPLALSTQAVLIGRVIVQQGATTASKIDSAQETCFKTLSLLNT